MDFSLSEKQRQIREIAREIAARSVEPLALERHKSGEFPRDILKELASAKLMGINIDPRYGGAGAGVVAYSLAVTTIAAADPAAVVVMAVNNMVSEVIQEFGSEEQKQTLIPRMTSGEFPAGSFCLSEPGAGSDAAGMRTRAEKTDQGWVINGTKAWITSGAHAGVYLVWAKTDDDEISLFVVDPKSEGITVGAPEEKMGQHASDTVALSFDDVQVPENAMLGARGQGFRVAMMALDGGRIGIASQALGIADKALAIGTKAGALSPHKRRQLTGRLEAARTITWRAAWLKEQQQERFSRPASMAKLTASEVATDIVAAVYQGWPPTADEEARLLLEKFLRDARVTRIYEGTSEVQRIVIARDLIRRAASS